MMGRVIAIMLVGSFALFAGSPARADLILGDVAPAAPSGSPPDGSAGPAGSGLDPASAEQFAAAPDQVQPTACVECVGLFAAVVFAGAVYFFGATATPTPGW